MYSCVLIVALFFHIALPTKEEHDSLNKHCVSLQKLSHNNLLPLSSQCPFHLESTPLREIHPLRRRRIAEPAHPLSRTLINQPTRQLPPLLALKNTLQNVLLARASSHKRYARRVLHNGQRQRNALGRRLGRVLDAEHPGVRLAELRVAGEQAASVAVGPAAQQQEVEERELDAVAGGEDGDEGLFVGVGGFLRVVEEGLVDGEDFGRAEGGRDLGEELFLHELVVGVFVGERDAALVGVEDLPLAEVGGGVVVGGEEGFGEDFGEGAAGDGDAEGVVAGDGFVLGFEDVFAQVGREVLVDVGEGVEVDGAASHGCGCD